MKLDFCVVCGTKDDLHQHHIEPLIRGKIKKVSVNKSYDENKSLKDCDTYEIFGFLMDQGFISDDGCITVCSFHHNIIHGVLKYTKAKATEMIKKGQEAARERGVKIGRPSNLTLERYNNIKEDLIKGELGIKRIAKKYGVGVGTIYSIKNMDEFPEHLLPEKTFVDLIEKESPSNTVEETNPIKNKNLSPEERELEDWLTNGFVVNA
jgi:hypothetical protein